MIWDVAIVGGGPAGLAAAIEARRVGCSVVLLERQAFPVDKACGEGLMPTGLAALERMGVRARIPSSECSPFGSIAYVQEDGRSVEGRLPAPGGLGIRRLALAEAMTTRAREVGVELHEDSAVRSHAIDAQGVTLQTDARERRAQLLVAADGLHSPLRKAEGLERRRIVRTTGGLIPAAREIVGEAIQHRTGGSRQDHEPEEHAEHMAVRSDQSLFDRQPADVREHQVGT